MAAAALFTLTSSSAAIAANGSTTVDGAVPDISGTPGPDVRVVFGESVSVLTFAGNDTVIALRSARLVLGAGDDFALGEGSVQGDEGNDTIVVGDSNTSADGGPGDDRVFGGAGPDELFGGLGADVIYARGGGADRVDCGPGVGVDVAVVGLTDKVTNCEIVRRPRAA